MCLVLGGGNVSSIPPMDVLYKLFVEDEVVLLKMNPVNEALGPDPRAGAAPARRSTACSRSSPAAPRSAATRQSIPKVGSLHVTGSDRTYDAIVWGKDPEERARRKKSGETRRTSGPSPRSSAASRRCSSCPARGRPRTSASRHATSRRWSRRTRASTATPRRSSSRRAAGCSARRSSTRSTRSCARRRARKAYYPGARERHRAFVEQYPSAIVLGAVPTDAADEVVPWTAIPDVPPTPAATRSRTRRSAASSPRSRSTSPRPKAACSASAITAALQRRASSSRPSRSRTSAAGARSRAACSFIP